MAHPSLTKKQATLVNIIALGTVAALALVGILSSTSLERSEADTPMQAAPSTTVGLIDTQRILAADEAPGDWLAYGRDYGEQRFSPLTQINKKTIKDLELAWSFDMYTNRGLEASPIVVDGIMYMTGSWSVVFAVDAKTGEEIWSYDPEVPGDWARKACCDVVNRGVAVYEGAVFVATLDGYLVALNAENGEVIWRKNTIIDRTRSYTITGAPRVANGRVFIGNGGGEYGVRGYVTAYDTKTGEEDWRFFTVPGDPTKPFEHPEMELAAKTWKGGEWWKIGGGGTVWNSIVYDAETDTVFLGVGNGSPWTRTIRSPGGGDNLFLSAIVALNASNGEMRWYYQTTPGDNWDYTAVQDMMLADMEVDGVMRKVIMQAPKNGFFYVLDRQTGELLRANPYVTVNWASHIDMETGRPVENPDKDFLTGNSQWILPGPLGGHNWQSMSYNPNTGLVYIPALENPLVFDVEHDFKATGRFKYIEGGWNTGVEFGRLLEIMGEHPDLPKGKGYITAFDPLTGKTHWTREHGTHWNGGTLSTAADLVFQGNGDGYFVAYDAQNGDELWKVNTYTSTIAPPVTYSIDGEQYVAIQVGSGGAAGLTEGDLAMPASAKYGNFGRMLAFKINGGLSIDEPEHWARDIPEPPVVQASAAQIEHGGELYGEVCGFCHGIGVYGGPAVPDLRKMSEQTHRMFNEIVLEGVLEDRGMSNFSDRLSEADVNDIYAYINSRSWQDYKLQEEAKVSTQSGEQTSALAN
ncbi:MAG: PQQ-dependent dehydrogenase, methanol/ethanol family [Pseudomonadota bacterium]|nr:PQQ-dependent dehydrogenase, methanol/ethanol family [Pseudomonadota bacterium]